MRLWSISPLTSRWKILESAFIAFMQAAPEIVQGSMDGTVCGLYVCVWTGRYVEYVYACLCCGSGIISFIQIAFDINAFFAVVQEACVAPAPYLRSSALLVAGTGCDCHTIFSLSYLAYSYLFRLEHHLRMCGFKWKVRVQRSSHQQCARRSLMPRHGPCGRTCLSVCRYVLYFCQVFLCTHSMYYIFSCLFGSSIDILVDLRLGP